MVYVHALGRFHTNATRSDAKRREAKRSKEKISAFTPKAKRSEILLFEISNLWQNLTDVCHFASDLENISNKFDIFASDCFASLLMCIHLILYIGLKCSLCIVSLLFASLRVGVKAALCCLMKRSKHISTILHLNKNKIWVCLC